VYSEFIRYACATLAKASAAIIVLLALVVAVPELRLATVLLLVSMPVRIYTRRPATNEVEKTEMPEARFIVDRFCMRLGLPPATFVGRRVVNGRTAILCAAPNEGIAIDKWWDALNEHSPLLAQAALAHEVGHLRQKGLTTGSYLYDVCSGAVLALALGVPLATASGLLSLTNFALATMALVVGAPVGAIVEAYLSRCIERDADATAVSLGYAVPLAQCLGTITRVKKSWWARATSSHHTPRVRQGHIGQMKVAQL
jgi:Zn-dependent protease with chaperone function